MRASLKKEPSPGASMGARRDGVAQPILCDYWMTITDSKGKCELHATSWARGYVSRVGSGHNGILPYKGRYGEGYKVYTASWESTRYCRVRYYIREEAS